MRIAWLLVGVLMVIAGAVWTLQGLDIGFAPHSFMTADPVWVVVGVVTCVAGLALATWSWRRG